MGYSGVRPRRGSCGCLRCVALVLRGWVWGTWAGVWITVMRLILVGLVAARGFAWGLNINLGKFQRIAYCARGMNVLPACAAIGGE